ncbi:SMP-30/gluconolactonase/LRE family protein [Variovorax ginsengisoli]|uniref:SMP-30/gluconolactonase/LRE family protein n=1 Tax=Variovorax ginsengisoli TaxID=363844 RepID=A0ABT8SG58_9BURK|nr:SMP-30/gluconolactonase/LRE family protein [Variovorax ginsengisoli]MDN8618178.1 SMP-30/gluconolactonase/LRE family protein [Variovorax ginsengisoli]MDO1537348.1 SMP-30/gluconolactonase/LRE family protein [Variovorax ginsengisoli]
MKILAEGLQFPEGPVALVDGSVVLVEMRAGRIIRVTPEGRVEQVADCGGGPNGAAIGPDGALYVCDNGGSAYAPGRFTSIGPAPGYQGGSIRRFDLATGDGRVLYTHCDGHRLSSPNDLVFDAQGGFYFTDFGKKHARSRDNGGLYYALPDGSRIVEVAYPLLAANGVGLSPDGATVYVAETETARLWAFDLVEAGCIRKHPFPSPHGGRLVCGLPGFQRFDSLALDAGGQICVATLITGAISVIAPSGELRSQVAFPDTYVTNICFGGPDLKTAFVTLSGAGQLVSLPWPHSGPRLHFNA